MRYDDSDRKSSNLEDRRGERPRGFGFPGMGRGGRRIRIPVGGRGGMSLTTLLILGGIMLLFGINPLEVLLGSRGGLNIPGMPHIEQVPRRSAERSPLDMPGRGNAPSVPATNDEMSKFMGQVLADTEDVWGRVFKGMGRRYDEPKLVLFTGSYPTACGMGMAAMGPFYCPLDRKIYIDLSFYEELKRKFKAPGDFAQAYVVAHEVGHHVQTLLGISEKVQAEKRRVSKVEGNKIQVRMELQADCLAGVWANLNEQMEKRLEPGDVEEALNAAAQIGDDMIQKRTQGHVVPDAFTHGTAAQRMRWFKKGFQSGDMQRCDTFKVREL